MTTWQKLQGWFQQVAGQTAVVKPRLDAAQRKELLAALAGERDGERWLAAEALGEADPGREGVAALAAVLAHPDPLLRSQAAQSLAQIGGKAAEQALLHAAAQDDARARAAAADGLGQMPASVESVAALASLLTSGDATVRQSAGEALARLTPPAAGTGKDGASLLPDVAAALHTQMDIEEAPLVRRALELALRAWDVSAAPR